MVLSPRSPHPDSYEALRARVHLLKKEHQKVVKTSQLESVALLQQRQKYEATTSDLQDEVASLRSQLRANTERSAKLRQHYDKDKKSLQSQVERLEKALEGCDAEHAARVDALKAEHGTAIAAARAELQAVQQGREDDRRAFERARNEAVNEVDEWCQGEVAALREVLGRQLEGAQAEALEYRTSAERAKARACDTAAQLEEACAQLAGANGRAGAAQAQVLAERAAHAGERGEWARRAEEAEREGQERMRALKAGHNAQLGMVEERVRVVVGGKDDAIAGLQAEVAEVTARLRRFEGLLSGAGGGSGGGGGRSPLVHSPARTPIHDARRPLDMRHMTHVK
ncbi:hypothetical protein FOA52_005621 [Chlamydomonas sp. UWO 241]|nr:hypothetical protein FOA52_005621 [Chlamydomonas sp. UWO 241]